MAASAEALLHFRCGHTRCGRLLRRSGPPPEGRDWRGRKTMEANMRVLSIKELMRLTDRADRSLRPDYQRPAGHAGRFEEPANRAHEPAQHPIGAGAA